MAETQAGFFSVNAGEISRHATARVDLAKLRVACETESNFLPLVVGPAQMRPGTQYIAPVATHANTAWFGEFYVDETTKILLVLQSADLRFLLADVYLTRVAVTAAVANGTFTTNLASWTDNDEAGAVSDWVAPGYMRLLGTGSNFAYRDQQVVVTETGTEHALRVTIARNTVVLRVGTAIGLGDYLDVVLLPGVYSLAFTPSGDFWIRLGAVSDYHALVDSITVEAAGAVSLPAPWTTNDQFNSIRYDQSSDVMFIASDGFQQRRIERRADNSRSWGLALYQTDDGPFRLPNLGSTTLAPSATSGAIDLTASRALFQAGHLGALFKLTHGAQAQTATLGALNDDTGEIRVTGLTSHNFSASSRIFGITIDVDGAWIGTVSLQRSIGAPGSWQSVKTWTASTSESYDDGLDNQIIYYKLEATAYAAGSALVGLFYNASSQTGIARLTSITSSTVATADVLSQFGSTDATNDWTEGEWSDYRGWPDAVAFHDGRLGWFPGIKAQLSVSDAFASFDDTIEGDAASINKTITTGGKDGIRWALSLLRLVAATAAQENVIRASAFDEPLTQTAFVARAPSTRGAAKVRPVKVDQVGIFVGRDSKRVYQLAFDSGSADFKSTELTRLKQEMCAAGVRDIAVQRQPDTRVWFVLGDGSCAVLTYELDDEVIAWTPVTTTNGSFERVAVLPGSDEDDVYFIVARDVGGTKRYIEKLAKRSEAIGGTISKTSDSHVIYSGASTTTITAAHLAGKQVALWADGAPQPALITLNGAGVGTSPVAFTNACYGLSYTSRLKPAKLAYGAQHGTAMTLMKRVSRIGFVMADVAWKGVRIGRDFSNMSGLPATYKGRPLAAGEVLSSYDASPVSFNGGWDPDSRYCLEISSPYCATVMGLALIMETNEPGSGPAGNDG